jgi:multiple sugar transport system substrate-binding protein
MFWGSYQDFNLWKKVKLTYEARYPDRQVKLIYVPNNYQDKLSLSLVAKSAADVFLIDDDFFKITAATGHLENLEPFINEDRDSLHLEDYFPHSLEAFQFNGKQYGLPWDGFTTLLFYNTTTFKKAHQPFPTENWTWQDLILAGSAFTHDLDGDGYNDTFGFSVSSTLLDCAPIIWSFGGRLYTPDLMYCELDSPKAIQALQLVHDIIYKYKIAPRSGQLDDKIMQNYIKLLTGRVASIVSGGFLIQQLRMVEEGLPWNISYYPSGPVGKFARASFDGIGIYRLSQHKRAAWDFIRLVLGSTVQREIAREGRALPIRKSDAYRWYDRPDTPQDEKIAIRSMERYGRTIPGFAYQSVVHARTRNLFNQILLPNADIPKIARQITKVVNKTLAEMRQNMKVWK